MSTHPVLDDFLSPKSELADGVRHLCQELETGGWYPRKRWGTRGIVYWPEGARRRQIVVDTEYPMNEYRLQNLTEHTGLPLTMNTEES